MFANIQRVYKYYNVNYFYYNMNALSIINFVEQFDEITEEEVHAYLRSHNPEFEWMVWYERLSWRTVIPRWNHHDSIIVAPSMEKCD